VTRFAPRPEAGLHLTGFAVLDALREPRCGVCLLSEAAGRAYLSGIERDGVNDRAVRDAWRRRGGLCPRHWRTWRELGAQPLSSAILAEDLLRSAITEAHPARRACLACDTERAAEPRYQRALEQLGAERIEAELAQGRGFLCLTHLARVEDPAVASLFRARLEQVLAELRTFIRAHDHRAAGRPKGPERDSWLRALRALGGDV
jgi:hypothetical protein